MGPKVVAIEQKAVNLDKLGGVSTISQGNRTKL